jgi:hypothetical protein
MISTVSNTISGCSIPSINLSKGWLWDDEKMPRRLWFSGKCP